MLIWVIFWVVFSNFLFIYLILDWFKIRIHNFFFYLLSVRLSRSHNLDRRFGRLTLVNSIHYFSLFLFGFHKFSQFSFHGVL